MPAERVYVARTCDTKLAELAFVRDTVRARGLDAVLVDLSTKSLDNGADISPGEVARFHPRGPDAVFTGDRGSSVRAMTLTFKKSGTSQADMGGIIGLGGSGGTAMISQAIRALPIGIPKIIVSTDVPGWPFHDPEADAALFEGLRTTIRQTEKRHSSPRPTRSTLLDSPGWRSSSSGRNATHQPEPGANINGTIQGGEHKWQRHMQVR